MERAVYDHMAAVDMRHPWYVGRRRVLQAMIGRLELPSDARILEIGCGTGHSLAMLSEFGQVDAVEMDAQARALASERLGRPVGSATLPALDGVRRGSYDLVALLDVLEHIADDRAALRGIAECLRSGGRILITVPAHPWLWSAHDEANHHFRRYSRKTLKAAIADAGLRLDKLSYFNSLLFPLAVAGRLFGRASKQQVTGDSLPQPFPWVLENVFAAERFAIGRLPFPPGLSLLAVVSRPGAT
jgi:SAM-dependent methyltransferase